MCLPAMAAKDTLIVALDTKYASMDNYATSQTNLVNLFFLVGDPLVERNQDGSIRAHLVNEWKNIDPTTWEYHLREGVRFHNGNELTAESVRFTMMDFILDQNRRKELYSQAQRRIIEQAYWMPTFLQYQIMAAKKDLEVSASPDEMVSFHHAYWK